MKPCDTVDFSQIRCLGELRTGSALKNSNPRATMIDLFSQQTMIVIASEQLENLPEVKTNKFEGEE